MCNVLKPILFSAGVMALAFSAGCSSEEARQREAASSLLDQARALAGAGSYEEAFVLLDSIDRSYHGQIEIRNEATVLRSASIVDHTTRQLEQTDSIIAVLESALDGREDVLMHVDGPDGASGYYVDKRVYKPGFLRSTSLEARMSDMEYVFHVVAVTNGKRLGVNQFALVSDNGEVRSAALDFDDPRVGDDSQFGTDLATFTASEVSEVTDWLRENAPSVKKAVLYGKNGSVDVPFSPVQALALADTWEIASNASRLRQARSLRDKLERKLVIARDHTANVSDGLSSGE